MVLWLSHQPQLETNGDSWVLTNIVSTIIYKYQ